MAKYDIKYNPNRRSKILEVHRSTDFGKKYFDCHYVKISNVIS